MAKVKPFKAWRYDTAKTPELSNVVVPPYDVISEEELAEMDTLSPYNYSKIILGKGENKHVQAAARLKEWKNLNILIQEEKPALYFYEQEFNLTSDELFCQNLPAKIKKGGSLKRYGFFTVVQVEDYKKKIILPHEKTFAKYKADRYELMTAAQGNMEPVFLGYDSKLLSGKDFKKIVAKKKPTYSYTDRYGVQHKLWAIDDKKITAKVAKQLSKQKLYILDGHHRYETALKFYQDHKSEKTRYVLADVCAFKQVGTIILPTYRLVSQIPGFSPSGFLKQLEKTFSVEPVASVGDLEKKLMKSKVVSFGIKLDGEQKFYFIKLKKAGKKVLDLDYLHGTLLPDLAGGNVDSLKVFYVKALKEFHERMDNNEYQVGFLVKPNTYDDVVQKAKKGEVMPHKSTFFYPKIPSGLVINSFDP